MSAAVKMMGINNIMSALAELPGANGKSIGVKVGILESANNTKHESVAPYAIDNEYGNRAKNIPPRPFMRTTVDARQNEWSEAVASLLAQGDTPEDALNKLGEVAAGDIKQTIADWRSPPNSEETIERKGSDKPLVDTGDMLKSVTYEIIS